MNGSVWKKINPSIILACIATAGVLIRIIPFISELQETSIFFHQPDNYHYLRRALSIIENFPRVPSHDIYVSYPALLDFASTPWYPFMIASISMLVTNGAPTAHAVELVSAGITALCGGLLSIPVFLWTRRMLSPGYGLFAAALSITMPLHYWYSSAVAGDHHATEILLGVSGLYLTAMIMSGGGRRYAISFILSVSGLFLTWLGAPLYAGGMGAFALLCAILDTTRSPHLKRFALLMLCSAVIVAAAILIFPPFRSRFAYDRYSFFSPLFLAGEALFLLALCECHGRRILRAVVFFTLVAGFAVIASGEIMKGIQFLLKREKGYIQVLEMTSVTNISYWTGRFNDSFVLRNVFFITLFLPFTVLLFLRRQTEPTELIFAMGLLMFGGLTLIQRRFGYAYAPFMAIYFSWFMQRMVARKHAAIGTVVLALFIWLSVSWTLNTNKIFAPFVDKTLQKAYSWLGENSPRPSVGSDSTEGTPAYSVFAPWHQGYYIVYFAKRPVIANNALLGSNQDGFIDSIKLMLTDNMDVFMSLIQKYNVRYVVVPRVNDEHDAYEFLGTPFIPPPARIYGAFGLSYGARSGEYPDSFRLVAVFPRNIGATDESVKIFELVKGAAVYFSHKPDTDITVTARVRSEDESFYFSRKLRTDRTGIAIFRLPYATTGEGTVTVGAYEAVAGKSVFRFTVSEEAVRDGKIFRHRLADEGGTIAFQ